MSMSVSTRGFAALEAKLGNIEKQTKRRLAARRALKSAAAPIRDAARRLCPKDEKILEQSIVIAPRARLGRGSKAMREATEDEVAIYVGISPALDSKENNVVVYSILAEFGYSMPAQPYMRPAWDAESVKSLDCIRDALTVEIKAVSK